MSRRTPTKPRERSDTIAHRQTMLYIAGRYSAEADRLRAEAAMAEWHGMRSMAASLRRNAENWQKHADFLRDKYCADQGVLIF